mmetsp:Transcript_18435/g.52480  ORF Transcript_18435/g.52480 Transcript_18435/m.52480 type:complete len:325 (-) Transcript_18435:953-1927(-)
MAASRAKCPPPTSATIAPTKVMSSFGSSNKVAAPLPAYWATSCTASNTFFRSSAAFARIARRCISSFALLAAARASSSALTRANSASFRSASILTSSSSRCFRRASSVFLRTSSWSRTDCSCSLSFSAWRSRAARSSALLRSLAAASSTRRVAFSSFCLCSEAFFSLTASLSSNSSFSRNFSWSFLASIKRSSSNSRGSKCNLSSNAAKREAVSFALWDRNLVVSRKCSCFSHNRCTAPTPCINSTGSSTMATSSTNTGGFLGPCEKALLPTRTASGTSCSTSSPITPNLRRPSIVSFSNSYTRSGILEMTSSSSEVSTSSTSL